MRPAKGRPRQNLAGPSSSVFIGCRETEKCVVLPGYREFLAFFIKERFAVGAGNPKIHSCADGDESGGIRQAAAPASATTRSPIGVVRNGLK